MINRILNRFKNNRSVCYQGNYDSWDLAEMDCDGYDSDNVFQKMISSTWKVKNNEAVFERDSFLFYEKEYNFPLVTYINKALAESKECREILDFGGAFGSTYWQNRDILPRDIQWIIVEQKHFVDYGKENFSDNVLSFEYSIDDIASNVCALCSGSLIFIKNYLYYLDRLVAKKFEYIIIERTPVSDKARIWKEIVREPIYDATYPSYVFNEKEFVNYFISNNYILLNSWNSLVDGIVEHDGSTVIWKSFVFKRDCYKVDTLI